MHCSLVPWVRNFQCRKIISGLSIVGLICMVNLNYYDHTYQDETLTFYQQLNISLPFQYPLDIEDFPTTVEMFRTGNGGASSLHPINPSFLDTEFLQLPTMSSNGKSIGLLIIVKSARRNVEKRNIVRKTWGDPQYLKEAVISSELPTKLVFICGIANGSLFDDDIFDPLTQEHDQFQDIIVADFYDSYYNNTYKSVLALKWSLFHTQGFHYLALVDDDVHVDIVNICNYLRNLVYNRVFRVTNNATGYPFLQQTHRRDVESFNVSDLGHGLMIGRSKWDDPVIRDKIGEFSKWYASYEDYPYTKYPPYLPGAGIIFDERAVRDLYYGSLFVKYYRMDDVFFGIVVAKMGMLVLDCDDIITHPNSVSNPKVKDIMILHGLCRDQLEDFWVHRDFSKTKQIICNSATSCSLSISWVLIVNLAYIISYFTLPIEYCK